MRGKIHQKHKMKVDSFDDSQYNEFVDSMWMK